MHSEPCAALKPRCSLAAKNDDGQGPAKKGDTLSGAPLVETLVQGPWPIIAQLAKPCRCGSLRRTTPVSDCGWSRGLVINRYYIETFLGKHSDDVRGHVLEFADDSYARKFGGAKTTKIDVLHLTEGNPRATLVADISRAEPIPSDTFDCIICTQVLLYVYDVRAAIRTLHRIRTRRYCAGHCARH